MDSKGLSFLKEGIKVAILLTNKYKHKFNKWEIKTHLQRILQTMIQK